MPAQILVVDPDPAVQQVLRLNFSSAGYRVDCCPDATTCAPGAAMKKWDVSSASVH